MIKNGMNYVMVSILLLVNISTVSAESLPYDYIGAGFNSVFLNKNEEIHLGFALLASKKLSSDLYIRGQYGQVTKEIVDTNVSLHELKIMVGYIYSLTNSTDVDIELGYVSDQLSFRSVNADDEGYLVAVKMRSQLSHSVMISGGFANIELSDNHYIEVAAELSYAMTDKVDFVVNLSHSDLKPYSGLFAIQYKF